jgi:hypothetical protein
MNREMTVHAPKPGEAVGRELVVAGCNPTALFYFIEEPLNRIPSTAEVRAEADRLGAIASWCDVGPNVMAKGERYKEPIALAAYTRSRRTTGVM